MLFAQCGMYFLATGTDLVTLFIGLELMALCFYVMVGFLRSDRRSNEAAHEISDPRRLLQRLPGLRLLASCTACPAPPNSPTSPAPSSSARPGTRWSSSPSPPPPSACSSRSPPRRSTCGRRTPTKARPPRSRPTSPSAPRPPRSPSCCASSSGPLASARDVWEPLLAVIAVLTLTVGNLAAINQTNIKRMLAYSSISHAGYMLLGLIAGNDTGINGIAVYIMVYTFMNLGALLVVVAMRRAEHHRRGPGRYGRPGPQAPRLRLPDADLPAVARRHPSHRGLPRASTTSSWR